MKVAPPTSHRSASLSSFHPLRPLTLSCPFPVTSASLALSLLLSSPPLRLSAWLERQIFYGGVLPPLLHLLDWLFSSPGPAALRGRSLHVKPLKSNALDLNPTFPDERNLKHH